MKHIKDTIETLVMELRDIEIQKKEFYSEKDSDYRALQYKYFRVNDAIRVLRDLLEDYNQTQKVIDGLDYGDY